MGVLRVDGGATKNDLLMQLQARARRVMSHEGGGGAPVIGVMPRVVSGTQLAMPYPLVTHNQPRAAQANTQAPPSPSNMKPRTPSPPV
jgi:sugar (pentulose or hexulose) kinase